MTRKSTTPTMERAAEVQRVAIALQDAPTGTPVESNMAIGDDLRLYWFCGQCQWSIVSDYSGVAFTYTKIARSDDPWLN